MNTCEATSQTSHRNPKRNQSMMRKSTSENVPSAIICLDEERELFYQSLDPQMRFLVFRRAMRHRSRLSVNLDTKSFFALLLDTSAQVSDFSPPRFHNHSAKSVSNASATLLDPEMMIEQHRFDMLFPPIYIKSKPWTFSVQKARQPQPMTEATWK